MTIIALSFGFLLTIFGATSVAVEYRALRGTVAYRAKSFFFFRYLGRSLFSPSTWCLYIMFVAGIYLLAKVFVTLLPVIEPTLLKLLS